MNNKNHKQFPYKNERRRTPPSHGNVSSRSPSYKRSRPAPSHDNGPKPSPSYKISKDSSSRANNHSTTRYKNQNKGKRVSKSNNKKGSEGSKLKKLSTITFSLIIASSLVLYGSFNFFNQPPISNTNEVEKIAVFFWLADIIPQSTIDGWIDIFEDEGYTKFFCFEDSDNFAADFQKVADYEDFNDVIFFHFDGHGCNDGSHSYTQISSKIGMISSNGFRDMCDTLDSSRIGLLVESCNSGDWADDMRGGGYLAMSTSNETCLSYAWAHAGIFSYTFYNAIESGSNAIAAFSVAEARVQQGKPQSPKLCDESKHDFFGN